MCRRVRVTAVGIATVFGALASAADFQTLLPIEHHDEVWSSVLVPGSGPRRDGLETVALRWPVERRPGPNSPALLLGWHDVAAIRFWLHVDKPRPYRCNVLLTGTREYFNSTVELDFSGWRQFTLPIAQLAPVRGAALEDMRSLSFRMQGYGQPKLDEGMVWWLDHIEAKPREGKELMVVTDVGVNRTGWLELARAGNPFLRLNERRFERPLSAFAPPEEIRSSWQYRSTAEDLVGVAYACAGPESPHRARQDLVTHALAGIDWLVEECHPEGWWYRHTPPTGDPNVNRFTLGPLLDAVRLIRRLPEGEAGWSRWSDRLATAVELQRRAYHDQEPWDWGGKAGGQYANQDLYYVLIMALSAILYERPTDQIEAENMLRRVALNLLPDGGIKYIGVTNEAPVYHALNLLLVGRYATLSGDEAALGLLRDTSAYWPHVLTAEGQPEYWSDVWWKQTWGYVWRPEALTVAAGATGDGLNQWLMWRVLERTPARDGGCWGVWAAPYWTSVEPGIPLPERFLVRDQNIRGIRGRASQWYFGVARGRGLRNTFVGGLVTHPTAARPLLAAFRGAQIDVLPENVSWRGYGRWLSEIDDNAGLALRPEKSAAIGARYTLQSGLINGWPVPETPKSAWQVTQVWSASADGHVGMVTLEALPGATGATVAGRIALGPRPPERVDPQTWASGPIRLRFFETFGSDGEGPTPHYTNTPEKAWHGVVLSAPLKAPVEAGDRFTYACWVGPEWSSPPTNVALLPDDVGWHAVWSDGKRTAALFNPGEDPARITIPWVTGRASAWSGEDGAPLTVETDADAVTIDLGAGQCAIAVAVTAKREIH